MFHFVGQTPKNHFCVVERREKEEKKKKEKMEMMEMARGLICNGNEL